MVCVDVGVTEAEDLLICYDPVSPYLWATGGQTRPVRDNWPTLTGEMNNELSLSGLAAPNFPVKLI